jgi:hypothetical protein
LGISLTLNTATTKNMGYFTIDLPNHPNAEVRYGNVRKKRSFFSRRNPGEPSIQRGYIITIGTTKDNQKIHHLFKYQNGEWSTDPDGIGKLVSQELLEIKEAILAKEATGM